MLSEVNVFVPTCLPLEATLEGRVAERTHFENLILSRVVRLKSISMLNCTRTSRRMTSTTRIMIGVTSMLVRQCCMRRVVVKEKELP